MILWNNPFNNVVRSHEAGIIGVLAGIIIGVIAMVFVTITISHKNVTPAVKLCGKLDNVDSISVSYVGTIKKIKCKDNRIFDNF